MIPERRKSLRIPLDSIYFLEIGFTPAPMLCMVMDISSGGMMLELPPSARELEAGEKGTVRAGSAELLEALSPAPALTVMWVKDKRCGVSFDLPQYGVNRRFMNADFAEAADSQTE